MTQPKETVSIMTEGPVEVRVGAILEGLLCHNCILKSHPRWGVIFINSNGREWVVVPRDVMEYMLEHGLIEWQEAHS